MPEPRISDNPDITGQAHMIAMRCRSLATTEHAEGAIAQFGIDCYAKGRDAAAAAFEAERRELQAQVAVLAEKLRMARVLLFYPEQICKSEQDRYVAEMMNKSTDKPDAQPDRTEDGDGK